MRKFASNESAEENDQKTKSLSLAIFDKASEKIFDLDLSFLNLKVYKIDSEEFNDLIESISTKDWAAENLQVFERFLSNSKGYHPHLHALFPGNIESSVDEEVFRTLEKCLLIMFPSDFNLLAIVKFGIDVVQTDKFRVSHWFTFESQSHWWIDRKNPDDYLLDFDESHLDSINEFLQYSYALMGKIKYLNISIDSYVNGFKQSSLEMAYISYCIAIEALVDSKLEVTDKISRTCAVLNSGSKKEGDVIYKNTKKLYSLRSEIVHGESLKMTEIKKLFFPLQALVSRTLIELLRLNIPERKILNNLINQAGFGDKANLADGYQTEVFNPMVLDLMLKDLSV